ncbi:hypothetical protein TSUD_306340 [Trifolium subterraneum]|uniref:Uncharacterized protein n=1 Tax=Trifolium subterraneum TaxID=3900 RepID=A0A2Z6MJ17_TRISU|nr:hypothetical protein TSUD_306340 [Trifolium subterraneum]
MVLATMVRAGPNYWKLFLFQILNGFVQPLLHGLLPYLGLMLVIFRKTLLMTWRA